MYCTNALGMSAAVVGTLFMVSKIFDGVTDLVAGYIVDKTNTKIGRGRPYDLCIIGLWFTTWLQFSVPASFSMTAKCVWVFVCYTLCQSVFRSFMNAAGTPYMVRAFNNDQKYIKLSSIGGIITTAAVIVFNVIFPMFYAGIIYDASGWSRLVGMLAIDCADYNEWKGNARMKGTLSSVTGFANKIGAAFGTFIVGVLLTVAGFDGTLEVQTAAADNMIRFIYAWIPAIFALIACIALHFYTLDKKKAQISADLAERRANAK